MKKILYIIPFLLSIFLFSNYCNASVIVNSVSDFQNRVNNAASENNLTAKIDLNTIDTSVFESFISDANNGGYYVFFLPSVVNDTFIRYVMYKVKDLPTISLSDSENGYYHCRVNFKSSTYSFHSYDYNLSTKKLVDANIQQTNVPNTDGYESCSFITAVNGNKVYNYDVISFLDNFVCNFPLKFDDNSDVFGPEFSFIPTYSENYKTCNLKLDIKNAPEYYTLEYAINSSTSEWYEFNNTSGITVENNCLVIVRMLDENGDEIFASSINVSLLDNQLSTTYFKVDFDNPGTGHLNFTPIIYYNFGDKFDLYLSINSNKDVYFTSNSSDWYMYNDKDLIRNLDYFKITPSNTYRLISKSTILDFDITLNFKLVNKTTGVTGLERSFTFNMGALKTTQAISSSTNSVEDKLFHTGGTNIDNLDDSINNPFSNINNNSSFEDIASVAEESFTTFSALFSILPGFIWALVAGAIGILIFLRVLGR